MDEDVEMSDHSDGHPQNAQQVKQERFGSDNEDSQHKNKHEEGASSRSDNSNGSDGENSETEDNFGPNQERITRSAAIRSVASALSSAEVSQEFGLFGPIASNTYRSVTRLSHAFGFGSDASFATWLDGDSFKPFYDELQEALRNFSDSIDTTKKSRQGPQLMAVQKAITAGESYGKQRYSRRSGPITKDFSELDFYALCLFNLVDFNTVNRNGAFFNKKVPVPDMQVRVWHAMLHVNYSNAPSRRSKSNPNKNISPDQNTPQQPVEGSAHGQKSPQQNVHQEKEPHMEQFENTSSIQANWNILKGTMNPSEPFELDTNYGRYITIHTALKGYEDPITIQTLYVQHAPASNEGHDIEAFNQESRSWFNELERSYHTREIEYQKATSDEVAGSNRLEDLLDNPAFQRLDYSAACNAIGITDTKAPRLPGMMPTTTLKSWQVTGIDALVEFEKNQFLSACVVADSTGLGKTRETIGFWKVRLDKREMLAEKPPAKPLLLIAPAEVLPQWIADMDQMSEDFIHVMYYGSKNSSAFANTRVDGVLTRQSIFFNGDEKNARTVILTSPETLRARHGPSKLRDYRVGTLGWTGEAAQEAFSRQDLTWERDLSALFDLVTIDEAHAIKNPLSAMSTTISWLKPSFMVLVTATVLPNSLSDWEGFAQLIQGDRNPWTQENLEQKGVTIDTNPYELDRDHPAAQELQLSMRGIKTWVTAKDVDPYKSGEYLKKIWERCLLRRTYSSVDPAGELNALGEKKRIGESLPLLFTRRIICRFTETEQKRYDELSREPLQKLAKYLPDGRIVWNQHSARQLILLSTSLLFHYIHAFMMADTVKQWKESPNLLWDILKFIHGKQGSASTFTLPGPNEVAKQLAVICQGSPKLRQLLQMVASLVVLSDKKIGVWSSTPANQLLLCACFRALRIDAAIYTPELNPEERNDLVRQFTTEPDKCHIFVGSYSVGSVGLNLQALCHHAIDFDSPSKEGQSKQSIGRFRRISQPYNVERFELSVENSFQSRIIQNALRKAIPGATAELAVNMTGTINRGEVTYAISSWYRVGDELIEAPDPRVDSLPVEQRLTAKELVTAILDIRRGRREEAMMNRRWVTEPLIGDVPDGA